MDTLDPPRPTAMMLSEVTGGRDVDRDDVVLIPGGLTGWVSWEEHAKRLSAGHRTVRVQLRSVELGLKDELLPPDYSVDYETMALEGALDRIPVSQAHFVAWSYGAEIALNFALNNPDRVKTLTLIEPPAIWVLRSRGPISDELAEGQRKLQSLSQSADVSEAQLEWFARFAGFVPREVDPKSLPQWPRWMQHRRSLRTGDVVYRHHDSIQRVRGFKRPVLLFKGEGSSDFLHEIIDILSDEFPDSRVRMLRGGHAPQLGSMDEFMRILDMFLAENPAT
jgi:pimeloyl-ACP methyl ester carboxylesterase